MSVKEDGSSALFSRAIRAIQYNQLGPTVAYNDSASDHAGLANQTDAHGASQPRGRIESIPLRGSVRIRNITEPLAVGSLVRILRYNGGLKLWTGFGNATRRL